MEVLHYYIHLHALLQRLLAHNYHIAVTERDEYRTTKWRKFHLGSHYLIQTVYAHVHSDISLADVILGIFV